MATPDQEPFVFVQNPVSEVADFTAVVGGDVSSKDDLMMELELSLQFPGYWGRNWDALEDMLTDLHWLKQGDVLIAHRSVGLFPDSVLRAYLDVLCVATESWAGEEARSLRCSFSARDRDRVWKLRG